MAVRSSGLEAGGNHSEGSNVVVVVYLLRFNFFIHFFLFIFFRHIFALWLVSLYSHWDHLQLRKIFAMTYF